MHRWIAWLTLLAGIVVAPAVAQATPGDPAKAQAALSVLQEHCTRCHGVDPKARSVAYRDEAANEFGFVDDLDRLAGDTDYVNPGKPQTSLLWQVMQDGSMPKDKKGGVPAAQLAAVADWILSLGKVDVDRPQIGEQEIIAAIRQDLDQMQQHGRKASRLRSLTLTQFHNLGETPETLRFLRDGTAKVVWSLSWMPGIEPLAAIGPEGSIVRLDLDAMGWIRVDKDHPDGWSPNWELLVARYPYGILRGTDDERDMQTRTGTLMPYLRADWFAFIATRPPVYEQLLIPEGESDILATAGALEAYLRVPVTENIYAGNGKAVRFGIPHRKSGVSYNNRLIERHAIGRYAGAYWKSYDFKSSSGSRNLLSKPLGPESLKQWSSKDENDATFRHDGGEIIWNLPNGLQAYLLVDGDGKRIEEGPLEVVFDKQGSTTRKRGVIVNGISCMACHQHGMQRPLVAEAVAPPARTFHRPRVQQAIQRLYATDAAMKKLLDEDQQRFELALRKAGLEASTVEGSRDPVVELVQRFEQRLSLEIAAAEMAMSKRDLLDRLGGSLFDLKKILEGDLLDRDEWVLRFGEVVAAMSNKGELMPHGGEVPSAPGKQPAAAALKTGSTLSTGIGLTMIYVEPGEFQMGSPEGEAGRIGCELRHSARITKGYWLAETEVTQKQWRELMGSEPWKEGGRLRTQVIEGDAVAASYVSHPMAREFCRRLSERESKAGRLPSGYQYVLPTEAEWERAARAGSDNAYSYGNATARLGEFAVFDGSREGMYAHTVRSRKPNAWGFYDVHGNVFEWCADQCEASQGNDGTDTYRDGVADPLCKSGSRRVGRGGSWNDSASSCRSALRDSSEPGHAYGDLGFRPALAARSDHEGR